ncbi:anti-sigma factor [Bacillus sp. PK3_68]|uniref:anti-sigma factor n=1 Tax=Bacillus sp. PK3_68 TaxID=2027408 RepID=UPI000E72BB8D|nr:anti-sigma factor [Bacillus sp. PK3_68]RJS62015.1 hypothetical protein CJ483_19825 [Bacillus sp. PK3_68]
MDRECDYLLSFIANDLDKRKKRRFKEHLQRCPDCLKEYEQMTDVWHSLYLDIEEQEVPETLKSEVMDFIFDEKEENEKKAGRAYINEWTNALFKQFPPAASITVLLLTGLVIVLVFANSHLRNEMAQSSQNNEQPARVVSTFSLQAAELGVEHLNTGGSAVILQQGKTRSLVVQVNHLPQLAGSEVYQVWLLNNGKRESAGVFKPDESGAGILTYQLAQDLKFDQIGITVEPDQYSIEPRGEKIVGSS